MSGSALPQSNSSTTKATTDDSKQTKPDAANAQAKSKQLEEDDEFEDFPVEDWRDEETDMKDGAGGEGNSHLWEESWDDDEESEDFAAVLREELKKVGGEQKR
ncbi:MAG: hypothetical protein M1828_001779 [Chrysothrix sp. TS-e1954]|nr:MAG: hypothetical protein M1828_001779 [Chrysothrix sp. TS-e1954]